MTQNLEWSSIAADGREGVSIGEIDPPHHVHLPQFHRVGSLPAFVILARSEPWVR